MSILVKWYAKTDSVTMQAQGQGHNHKSWDLSFNFLFDPFLIYLYMEFH